MTSAVAATNQPAARAAGIFLVTGIVLASLTEALASTVLALGRGDIIGDTHATPDEFAWLDVGYTALKLFGFAFAPWLLTQIEPRRLLLLATMVMGAACMAAAFTTGLELLVGLRMLQGLSGAILLVSGQAILFWSFPASRQPVLQAIFATGSVVAPATMAPLFQGWLLDQHDWTWIFLAVLPIALAAAGFLLMAPSGPASSPERRPLDVPGLLLLLILLIAMTYVLSQGSRWDWFEASRIRWLAPLSGAALLLLAVRLAQAGPRGAIDLSIFKVGDFAFAFIVSFVAGAALFGSAFLIPAFAATVLGFTPTEAGELLLPSGAVFVATLFFAAWLMQVGRLPPITTVPFGILAIMIAMWMLSGSTLESSAADMMPAILLRGLGLGGLFLSITLIAFSRLPARCVAYGIGIFNMGRQLGGLIGVASLQTAIDHHAVSNQAVLGASITSGSALVSERLAAMTNLLAARGMDAGAAAKAATAQLGRAIMGQSGVIAFDTAFNLVALLFVFAAPIIVAIKIVIGRTMGHGPAAEEPEA